MCQTWTEEDQKRFNYFFQSGVIKNKSHIMRYLGIVIGKILPGGEFDWEKEFQCIFLLPVMFQNCIDWNKFFTGEKVSFSFKGTEYFLQIRKPEKNPKITEQKLSEISVIFNGSSFDELWFFSPEFPQGEFIATIFPDMEGKKKKFERKVADLRNFLQSQSEFQKLDIKLSETDWMLLANGRRVYLSPEQDEYLIIEEKILRRYKYVGEPIIKIPYL